MGKRAGKPMLGIDLREGALRLAVAHRSGRTWEVRALDEVPLPDGEPRPDLGVLLKEAAGRLKRPTRNAVVVLGFQHVMVRRLKLPRLPLWRLRQLVEQEKDRYIPFYAEGANFHLEILKDRRHDRQVEVLLAAAPSRLIQPLIAACKTARLRLRAVDIDLVALRRVALATGATAEGPGISAVVEVAGTAARIGLFQEGVMLAGRGFTLSPGDGALEVAAEVRRSLEVLLSQYPMEDKLVNLALAGEVADGGLARELLEVLRADIAPRLDEAFAVNRIEMNGCPPDAAALVAVGGSLAMAAVPFAYDLLPRTTFEERRQRTRKTLLTLAGIAAAGAYGWYYSMQIPDANLRITMAENQIRTSQEALKRRTEVEQLEARRKELSQVMDDLRAMETPAHQAIPAIRALAPQGLTIADLSGQLPDLSIKGTCKDPALVVEFVARLSGAPFITGVSIQSVTAAGTNEFNYSLSIAMKGQRKVAGNVTQQTEP